MGSGGRRSAEKAAAGAKALCPPDSVRLHFEAGARDGEGDNLALQAYQGLLDGGLGAWPDHEDDAASAARAAHFGGDRALFRGLLDHLVDLGGRDASEVALAVVPFEGEQPGDVVPVAGEQRFAHPPGDGGNLIEVLAYVLVAVDVRLH